MIGRRRPLNAAAFLAGLATPEDNVAVTTMPIRKPDFLAGVVNSRLKFGGHPLIFCERAARRIEPETRVTVTYLTEAAHYLTLGDALGYLPAIDRRLVADRRADICFQGMNPNAAPKPRYGGRFES
ncbi:hypothetical protein [Bosea sp. 124]|uniref:hypothetical protein n=1 Tax=Bosea sp. 124 TaxID=2135642 RepID=UPI0011B255FA|nr:hypothetical protein [Bosea sp. 124]